MLSRVSVLVLAVVWRAAGTTLDIDLNATANTRIDCSESSDYSCVTTVASGTSTAIAFRVVTPAGTEDNCPDGVCSGQFGVASDTYDSIRVRAYPPSSEAFKFSSTVQSGTKIKFRFTATASERKCLSSESILIQSATILPAIFSSSTATLDISGGIISITTEIDQFSDFDAFRVSYFQVTFALGASVTCGAVDQWDWTSTAIVLEVVNEVEPLSVNALVVEGTATTSLFWKIQSFQECSKIFREYGCVLYGDTQMVYEAAPENAVGNLFYLTLEQLTNPLVVLTIEAPDGMGFYFMDDMEFDLTLQFTLPPSCGNQQFNVDVNVGSETHPGTSLSVVNSTGLTFESGTATLQLRIGATLNGVLRTSSFQISLHADLSSSPDGVPCSDPTLAFTWDPLLLTLDYHEGREPTLQFTRHPLLLIDLGVTGNEDRVDCLSLLADGYGCSNTGSQKLNLAMIGATATDTDVTLGLHSGTFVINPAVYSGLQIKIWPAANKVFNFESSGLSSTIRFSFSMTLDEDMGCFPSSFTPINPDIKPSRFFDASTTFSITRDNDVVTVELVLPEFSRSTTVPYLLLQWDFEMVCSSPETWLWQQSGIFLELSEDDLPLNTPLLYIRDPRTTTFIWNALPNTVSHIEIDDCVSGNDQYSCMYATESYLLFAATSPNVEYNPECNSNSTLDDFCQGTVTVDQYALTNTGMELVVRAGPGNVFVIDPRGQTSIDFELVLVLYIDGACEGETLYIESVTPGIFALCPGMTPYVVVGSTISLQVRLTAETPTGLPFSVPEFRFVARLDTSIEPKDLGCSLDKSVTLAWNSYNTYIYFTVDNREEPLVRIKPNRLQYALKSILAPDACSDALPDGYGCYEEQDTRSTQAINFVVNNFGDSYICAAGECSDTLTVPAPDIDEYLGMSVRFYAPSGKMFHAIPPAQQASRLEARFALHYESNKKCLHDSTFTAIVSAILPNSRFESATAELTYDSGTLSASMVLAELWEPLSFESLELLFDFESSVPCLVSESWTWNSADLVLEVSSDGHMTAGTSYLSIVDTVANTWILEAVPSFFFTPVSCGVLPDAYGCADAETVTYGLFPVDSSDLSVNNFCTLRFKGGCGGELSFPADKLARYGLNLQIRAGSGKAFEFTSLPATLNFILDIDAPQCDARGFDPLVVIPSSMTASILDLDGAFQTLRFSGETMALRMSVTLTNQGQQLPYQLESFTVYLAASPTESPEGIPCFGDTVLSWNVANLLMHKDHDYSMRVVSTKYLDINLLAAASNSRTDCTPLDDGYGCQALSEDSQFLNFVVDVARETPDCTDGICSGTFNVDSEQVGYTGLRIRYYPPENSKIWFGGRTQQETGGVWVTFAVNFPTCDPQIAVEKVSTTFAPRKIQDTEPDCSAQFHFDNRLIVQCSYGMFFEHEFSIEYLELLVELLFPVTCAPDNYWNWTSTDLEISIVPNFALADRTFIAIGPQTATEIIFNATDNTRSHIQNSIDCTPSPDGYGCFLDGDGVRFQPVPIHPTVFLEDTCLQDYSGEASCSSTVEVPEWDLTNSRISLTFRAGGGKAWLFDTSGAIEHTFLVALGLAFQSGDCFSSRTFSFESISSTPDISLTVASPLDLVFDTQDLVVNLHVSVPVLSEPVTISSFTITFAADTTDTPEGLPCTTPVTFSTSVSGTFITATTDPQNTEPSLMQVIDTGEVACSLTGWYSNVVNNLVFTPSSTFENNAPVFYSEDMEYRFRFKPTSERWDLCLTSDTSCSSPIATVDARYIPRPEGFLDCGLDDCQSITNAGQIFCVPYHRTEDVVKAGYITAQSTYRKFDPMIQIDPAKYTHMIYAYANVNETGHCVLGDTRADIQIDYDEGNHDFHGVFQVLNQYKVSNPALKTILSVGGPEYSRYLSDAASNTDTRSAFVTSCSDLISTYGFDGLEIDWQFPIAGGNADVVHRTEDGANFVLLLEALRANGPSLLLTVTGPGEPDQISTLRDYWNQIQSVVDWINVMSFNYGDCTTASPHASLYPTSTQVTHVQSTLQSYMQYPLSVKPSNLVMGIPLSGRAYSLPETCSGITCLDQSAECLKPYYQPTVNAYVTNGLWAEHQDGLSHSAFATRERVDGNLLVSFESSQSLDKKLQYVLAHSLRGAFVWSVDMDTDELVIDAINEMVYA